MAQPEAVPAMADPTGALPVQAMGSAKTGGPNRDMALQDAGPVDIRAARDPCDANGGGEDKTLAAATAKAARQRGS